MSWCVYKHTSPSGKVYIGISSNISIRWSRSGFRYTTYNSIFKRAIEKYGWNNIEHKILFDNLTKEKAVQLEIDLIRHYKNLGISYNITDGGEGTLGRKVSEKTKGRDMTKAVLAQAKKKAKKVLAISSTGDRFIFNSRAEASSYIGSPVSNISRAIQHSYKVKNYKLYNYAD